MPRNTRLYTNQVNVYVSDRELESIEQLVTDTGHNRSVIIRAALHLLFEKHGLPTDPLDI